MYDKGTKLIYSEDGSHLLVEVLEDNSNLEKDAYKLMVVGEISPHPLCKTAEKGEIFESWQLKKGGWGGMWHLRTIEKFCTNDSRQKKIEELLK